MLQRLRIKFILLTMSLLFAVLAVIIGAANLLNYRQVLHTADQTLAMLLDGRGRFPERHFEEKGHGAPKLSPEAPFETRFFTVQLSEDGTALLVDTGKIAAITAEDAARYAEQVFSKNRTRGFVGAYRYAVRQNQTGSLVVFVDCGRQLGAARAFLHISIGISLARFLVVSLLLYVLSAKIVRPISDSYEGQRQFITNAGHDLKTPITIIDADLDVLEIEQPQNEWLQDIRRQTKRLAELIGQLIFLSRIEERDNHFQMIDFPISDVVEETAQSFAAVALTQGKRFTMQVQPLLSYCGDDSAIRRLVGILLDNAIKYSDEGGSISLSLERTGRALRLTVYNTCAPISAEDCKHFFERFYRGDRSRNTQSGGYGIGLSIAKALIEAHRGTISAATTDGRSLTVTATLPLKSEKRCSGES